MDKYSKAETLIPGLQWQHMTEVNTKIPEAIALMDKRIADLAAAYTVVSAAFLIPNIKGIRELQSAKHEGLSYGYANGALHIFIAFQKV